MRNSNTLDMTTGSPIKHLLRFTGPLLVGNLFQQFYNMVDSMVVGNFVGANALAAVGACASMNFLFFSMSNGLSAGIGVIVAQYFGAKDEKHVRATIANSVYVLTFTAILLSMVGYFISPGLLRFLDTPAVILDDAILYLRTTCLGMIAIAAYNGVASILRALGDSKTPLYFLILASVINVILDLVFVLQFDMSVFGVALATIIAQGISAVLCLVYALKRNPYFRLKKEEMEVRTDIIGESCRLGIPLGFQSSLIAISCVALQGVVNSFGEKVVAAFTIISRIEQIVQQPYNSMGMAVTTYSGQNIGAGNVDRVKLGFRNAVWMALIFSLALLPIAWLFGEQIVGAFVNDPEVIAIGKNAIRITSLCYFGLGMIYVPRAVLNGCGDSRFAMINGLTEVCCRIGFSQICIRIPVIGYWGIWLTTVGTWWVTASICLLRYLKGKWRYMGIKS